MNHTNCSRANRTPWVTRASCIYRISRFDHLPRFQISTSQTSVLSPRTSVYSPRTSVYSLRTSVYSLRASVFSPYPYTCSVTGERPHKCEVCSNRFMCTSDLHSHLKMHSTEKVHACPECGKCYRDASYVLRHAKIHALQEETPNHEMPFRCDICKLGMKNAALHLIVNCRPPSDGPNSHVGILLCVGFYKQHSVRRTSDNYSSPIFMLQTTYVLMYFRICHSALKWWVKREHFEIFWPNLCFVAGRESWSGRHFSCVPSS